MTAPILLVEFRLTLDPETKTFFRDLVLPVIAGLNTLEQHMSTVEEALAALGMSVDELVKDTQRLIALFEAGQLTPEQQSAVDALQAKLTAIDAAVETEAPETPAP